MLVILMKFKSDSQRRAAFRNMNKLSYDPIKIGFKKADIIKFKEKIKDEDDDDSNKFSDYDYPRDYEYDYENVALKKYGKQMKGVPVKKGGRDRDVYLLDDERVLKVAKTAEGLIQNTCEGDCYLEIVPDVYEKGSDYVLAERANRDDPRTRKLLKPLLPYYQTLVEKRPSDLQEDLHKIDEEYGTDLYDVLNYDVGWSDFTSVPNWGWKEDMPKLIDAGSLSANALKKLESGDPTRREWHMILDERRKARRELGL